MPLWMGFVFAGWALHGNTIDIALGLIMIGLAMKQLYRNSGE